MRQVMLLVAAVIISVGTLSAQERHHQNQMDPQIMVEHLVRSLELSFAQAEIMTDIYASTFKPHFITGRSEQPTIEELQKKQDIVTVKVMDILTKEQQLAYVALIDSQPQAIIRRRGGRA